VLLPLDLRELAMLGDTGSNAIGAVAGLWLVLTLSTTGQAIALAVMAVVTVYGEFRSIATVIDRTPGLRHLESLGRTTHA
jgi:UDP-GlcNAc:undecaprenyl-phosphate GlcNAc-1-phosphate transferase